MQNRRLPPLSAIMIAAWPAVAIAVPAGAMQPIPITVSDHGRDSRVVFDFTPPNGFRVEQSSREITVTFPGVPPHFAYAAVYPRQAASRIEFAEPADRSDAAAFTMRFSCDCSTSVAIDDRRVLVEIRDRGNAEPVELAASISSQAEAAPDQPLPRRRPPHRRPSDGALLAAPAAGTADPDRPENPAARDGLAAHELDRLRASLEWAARQGFMDTQRDPDDQAAPPQNAAPTATAAAAGPEAAIAEVPVNEGAIDSQYRHDGGTNATAPVDLAVMAAEKGEQSCTGKAPQPAVDWDNFAHDDSDYLTALGRQRAALIGQPAPAALRAMALFYLAHGLYREALATMEAMTPAPAALRDAVLVLLGRGEEAGNALLDSSPCRPDRSVWKAALLKARGDENAAADAIDAALDALPAFPQHPRTVLALDLADTALNAGRTAIAGTLLDLADPAPGQSVNDMTMVLRGRIALQQGHPDRAEWYFRQAEGGSGEARRQGQIALIRHALAQGLAPPAWAGDAVRGALFDYRGSPKLLSIALLPADVRTSAGDHASALADLAAAAHRLPQTADAGPLRSKALGILQHAIAGPDAVDDALALQLFDDHRQYLADDGTSRAIRTRLARRMLAAGLPSVAETILRPLAANPPLDQEIAELMAEAALRTNRPDAAMDLLAQSPDWDGATARRLREQALTQRGRYGEAAKLAADASGQDAAALRWAAADWPAATETYAKFLDDTDAKTASAEDGREALRALAAAYMSGDTALPPPLAAKAMRIAGNAGLADGAAALASPPLTHGLTLPDAIAAALERSQQVRALFPARQP